MAVLQVVVRRLGTALTPANCHGRRTIITATTAAAAAAAFRSRAIVFANTRVAAGRQCCCQQHRTLSSTDRLETASVTTTTATITPQTPAAAATVAATTTTTTAAAATTTATLLRTTATTATARSTTTSTTTPAAAATTTTATEPDHSDAGDAVALRSLKAKSQHERASHFVDWRRIRVVAGNGGDGCIAFLHLFCNPDAGPAGGDGGHGGHVLLRAEPDVRSLDHVPHGVLMGWDGQPGLGRHCHGACGEHVTLRVPVGTVVRDADDGRLLADLDAAGVQFLAARGGAGGRGNAFYLSNDNRHPRVCQRGARGEERSYVIEMKTMAHAGLVGFPNAGKSTLLQAISRARPKVASYPFTTLRPHVGIVHFDDYEQLAVADLPGIIEGAASENRGLGVEFLRHADRCACLVYVVDVAQDAYLEQLATLRNELETYKAGFSDRMSLVIANKIDAVDATMLDRRLYALAEACPALPVVPMSAKFGTNVSAFVKHLRRTYDSEKAARPARAAAAATDHHGDDGPFVNNSSQ